jgi:multisubunit Na+/H+ antiporter MnhB subunit
VWTMVFATIAFLDAYRPGGDWRGGVVEASFAVLYGLAGSGTVWALDRLTKRPRRTSPA